MPDGVPRYAQIYDGGGVTAERYTVVLASLFSLKKPGEYPYPSMRVDPLAPGGSYLHRGRPPHERMGSEISYRDLPEYCKRVALNTYYALWGLRDAEGAV